MSTESVIAGKLSFHVHAGDCLAYMRSLPDSCIDLVFGSPPYEDARLYLENGEDIGIARNTEEWVAWMLDVYREAARVCRGLVAFVVGHGKTRKFRWSAAPAILAADLVRAGFNLRNPPLFHRVGIPGSGGPDWLRADTEWIICTARPGKLPWSDNTAFGHPPKWAPGGEMSHRLSNGSRVNQWGHPVRKDGQMSGGHNSMEEKKPAAVRTRPSHKIRTNSGTRNNTPRVTEGDNDKEQQAYEPPDLANPGNVISIPVGGGLMGGDQYASQNEAPFPEKLAEFFILSFCRPGGIVLDPFAGSGTTPAVALRHGRRVLACDLRPSQVALSQKRLLEETPFALLDLAENDGRHAAAKGRKKKVLSVSDSSSGPR